MSANIKWAPIADNKAKSIDTWRPSSFIERLRDRCGHSSPWILDKDDVAWLTVIKREMGRDGGNHSEAEQVIKAIKMHGRILIEVES